MMYGKKIDESKIREEMKNCKLLLPKMIGHFSIDFIREIKDKINWKEIDLTSFYNYNENFNPFLKEFGNQIEEIIDKLDD